MSCVRFEDPEAYRIDHQVAAPKLFTRAHSEIRRRLISSERRAFSILPSLLHSPSTLALALNNAASHCAPPPVPPITTTATLQPWACISTFLLTRRSRGVTNVQFSVYRASQRSRHKHSRGMLASQPLFSLARMCVFFGYYSPQCRLSRWMHLLQVIHSHRGKKTGDWKSPRLICIKRLNGLFCVRFGICALFEHKQCWRAVVSYQSMPECWCPFVSTHLLSNGHCAHLHASQKKKKKINTDTRQPLAYVVSRNAIKQHSVTGQIFLLQSKAPTLIACDVSVTPGHTHSSLFQRNAAVTCTEAMRVGAQKLVLSVLLLLWAVNITNTSALKRIFMYSLMQDHSGTVHLSHT